MWYLHELLRMCRRRQNSEDFECRHIRLFENESMVVGLRFEMMFGLPWMIICLILSMSHETYGLSTNDLIPHENSVEGGYGKTRTRMASTLDVSTPPPTTFVSTSAPTRAPERVAVSEESWGMIDILIAVFFLLAAGWLLMAIIYSLLILILLRLQSRGELDFYDEDFGLVRIGNLNLHFGCILRRYAIQLEREQRQRRERQFGEEPRPVRIMTRDERRFAMEQLLTCGKEVPSVPKGDEESSEEAPICTICMAEYEPTDQVFISGTCSHHFHKSCIMDWLERRANTECPICREDMVCDDEVWEKVKELRKDRREKLRKENGVLTRCIGWVLKSQPSSERESNEEFDLTVAASSEQPNSPISQQPSDFSAEEMLSTMQQTTDETELSIEDETADETSDTSSCNDVHYGCSPGEEVSGSLQTVENRSEAEEEI